MSKGGWEEENIDYEDEIGIETEVSESFDPSGDDEEAFSQSLENLNKPSELRPTSNHPLFVSPTGSLPSPSPTILHNNVGQALTHNLHIQILEALCCLYEKTIILITPLLSLRIPLMTSICSSLSPQFPQNICSNYSLCSA